MKEYNKANIPLAKTLRKNMTPWERKLWYEFLKLLPITIHRQKVLGKYIVDFYCAKAKLGIELDGSQHYEKESILKDQEREEYLKAIGLKVLRYPNNAINSNFKGVCQDISKYLREYTSPPTCSRAVLKRSKESLRFRSTLGRKNVLAHFVGANYYQ